MITDWIQTIAITIGMVIELIRFIIWLIDRHNDKKAK